MSRQQSSPVRNVIFIAIMALIFGGYYFVTKRTEATQDITQEIKEEIETVSASSSASLVDITEYHNASINCLNRLSSRIDDSYNRYDSWVDMEKGPTGKERNIYGLYEIYEVENCYSSVSLAYLHQETELLDSLSKNYQAVVSELYDVIVEAHNYYDLEDYKDDGMAKGKEMHPRLLASFDKAFAADQAVREELNQLKEIYESTWANNLNSQSELAHLSLITMDLSQQIYQLGTLEKFDVNSYQELIDSLQNSLLVLEKEATMSEYELDLSMYARELRDYIKEAKERMRRVRDGKGYSTMEQNWMKSNLGYLVDGSPAKLHREFNEIIGDYNDVMENFEGPYELTKLAQKLDE